MPDITKLAAQLRAAIAEATPGPWRWEINLTSRSAHLVGGRPTFDKTVMDFERWGFGGAAPRFNEAVAGGGYNIMTRPHERPNWITPFPGREHHANWCSNVTRPDAAHIALANPANLTALLDALDALMVDAERWRWIKPEDEMPHEHELVLVTIRFASGELHRCLAAYATDQSSGLLKWWDDDGSPIYNNVIRWARLPDAAIDAARRRG